MTNTESLQAALAKLSNDDAAKILVHPQTGKPVPYATIERWREDPSSIHLWAVEFLLPGTPLAGDASAAPAGPVEGYSLKHDGERAGHAGINPLWAKLPAWDKAKLWIGVPTTGAMHPKNVFAIYALLARHQGKIAFYPCENNPVGRARNILATHFLSLPEKPDYHLMIDDDMIVPFGNRKMYAQMFGGPEKDPLGDLDVVSRLVSHGKPLVGALYVGRSRTGTLQFAEAYENPSVNRLYRTGPVDKLLPVKWVATGALLIHRSVYEAIIAHDPSIKPRHANDVYRFFAMEDDEGEDMLFCQRARAAGIQPYVDLGCVCGHEGSYIYWPHNTAPVASRPEGFLDPKASQGLQAVKEAAMSPPVTTKAVTRNPVSPPPPRKLRSSAPSLAGAAGQVAIVDQAPNIPLPPAESAAVATPVAPAQPEVPEDAVPV